MVQATKDTFQEKDPILLTTILVYMLSCHLKLKYEDLRHLQSLTYTYSFRLLDRFMILCINYFPWKIQFLTDTEAISVQLAMVISAHSNSLATLIYYIHIFLFIQKS
jgi:hypothetical protein